MPSCLPKSTPHCRSCRLRDRRKVIRYSPDIFTHSRSGEKSIESLPDLGMLYRRDVLLEARMARPFAADQVSCRTVKRMRTQARSNGSANQGAKVNKGFGLLEWTGAIISQGVIVKTAKFGWNTVWKLMMTELAPQDSEGGYNRPKYDFPKDPLADETVESGRYHLYVGNACPWCHRVLMALVLRGLLEHVTFTDCVDDPERASRGGWVFDTPEPIFGANDLRQVYDKAQPGYRGRCTAPLLIDKKTKRIISNESPEILAALYKMQLPGSTDINLVPEELSQAAAELKSLIYNQINNGTYKSGFATTQGAYDKAQSELYDGLDHIEQRLAKSRFLLGDRFSEADLWLFPTIIRYDACYAVLFKCSRRRISADYPNITAWMKDIYQITVGSPSSMQIKDTFDVDDSRRSYFASLFPLNPGGIIPAGPTKEDLRLDEDPRRGPSDVDRIFYTKAELAVPIAA